MKTEVFCRTPFNYDRDKASLESGLLCKDPSLTQQQFKEECDINTIVERFHLTGEMPHVTELPAFQEFEGEFDYQTAMNAIVAARETFMAYPADIREQFDNDPHKFFQACHDEKQRDRLIEMGLAGPEARTKLQTAQAELKALQEAEKQREAAKPAPAKPTKD